MSDRPTSAGLTRRALLGRGLGAACCLAASPLVTPMVIAAAPGENRLVVIILRGAMDGVAAFPPLGDRALAAMRPRLGRLDGVLELDGRFGLHPALAPLLPLWRRGELAVAQAVATPYRDKRSHFDGQDLLEAGVSDTGAVRDGWLNRALALIPGATVETALSVGRENMLLLRGAAPARAWTPGDRLRLRNDERGLLDRLYAGEPLFLDAVSAAAALSDLGAAEAPAGEDAVTSLEAGLGPAWNRTLVVAMTEFGRTARENGSGGTDHGTGGAALLAGGALAGGRIYGDWPGIAEGALYEGRDLMPTSDVRHFPALALRALFGLPGAAIARDVFPGLDLGAGPSFLA